MRFFFFFFLVLAVGLRCTIANSQCVYNKHRVKWGPCNPKMQVKTKVANLVRGHSKCPTTRTYRKPCDVGSITINGCKYVQVSDWSECDKETMTTTRTVELMIGESEMCDNTTVESQECGLEKKDVKRKRKNRRGRKGRRRRKKQRRKSRKRKKPRKQKKDVCKYDTVDMGSCGPQAKTHLITKKLRTDSGNSKCDPIVYVSHSCKSDSKTEKEREKGEKKRKKKNHQKKGKGKKHKKKKKGKKEKKKMAKRTKKKDRQEISQEPPRLTEFQVLPYTTFVVVSWKPPEQEGSDPPAAVDGYQIGYGRGFPDVHTVTVNASAFTYRIEDLEPGGEYVISIRGLNQMGMGQALYDTVILRDAEADTPKSLLPPVGLRSKVLSSSAINISWVDLSIKGQEHQEDRVYYLRFRQLKRQSKSPPQLPNRFKTLKTNTTHMVLDNLRPYTKYEFVVLSSDNKQNSTWSIMVWNITGQAVPSDSPKDLSANVNPDFPEQVFLSWQPPSQPNGVITGYEILYTTTASNGPPITKALTIEGNMLSTKLTSLTPGLTYNLSVRATNLKGASPALVLNNYKIPGHSVPVPATLKATKVPNDPMAVLLQWKIPEHITTQGFDIMYSTNIKTDPVHWRVEKKFGKDLKETVMKNLRPGTQYFFKVRAQTASGYGSESNTVVMETPSASFKAVPADTPINLRVKILSSVSAVVSWQDPGMSKIIEMKMPHPTPTYTVRFRSLDSGPSQYELMTLHYPPLYVDDLLPMTRYEFSVRVKWEGEESAWTPSVEETTLASDSFQHPLKTEVKGHEDAPRVAIVSWQPHTDSKIKEYVVMYSMDTSKPHKTWIQKAALPQDVKREVFNDLKGDTTYFFYVQAMTDLGFGPRSKVVSYTTPKAAKTSPPLRKPEKLIAMVVSANSVVLNWQTKGTATSNEKSKDGEKVKTPLTFTVRYKDVNSKSSQYKYTSVPSPSLFLFDLRPSTTYEFSVKVNRGEHHSDWSSPVTNTTMESAPGSPPRSLKVSMDNGDPTSVILSWRPPRLSNGKITGYKLFYTEDPTLSVKDAVIHDISGTRRSHRLSFLQPQTTYHFRLRAVNRKGHGPLSDSVVYKTPRVIGQSPQDVTATTSPDNSYDVLISWQPPISPKRKIKFYTITHYTEEGKERHVEQVPGSTLTYMVKGLQASTTYHFSVQAHYRKGAGPHSTVVKYSIPKELILT